MVDLEKYKKDNWQADQDFCDLVYEELKTAGKPVTLDEVCQILKEKYGIEIDKNLEWQLFSTMHFTLKRHGRVKIGLRPPEYLERTFEAVNESIASENVSNDWQLSPRKQKCKLQF